MGLGHSDFDYISSLVLKRSGIVLEPEKTYLVESRLLPLARHEGLSSIAELVVKMRESTLNGLHQKVVEAMTTNETSFFRDHSPFEALRTVVLPELIQRRAAERRLHIWCGASSTGQEPYTIAIVLREHFPACADWNISIVATDLSTDVLARARAARYSQLEVNRGLPTPLLSKYFSHQGTEWVIKDEVRRLVEFRQLNLLDAAWNIAPADIIFLRNVLIYFDVATKKAILHKIRQVLRVDGWFFLGGAETTMNLDDSFERVPLERSGCYRLRKK
ncbi:MAG TPA: protein-glutamate O-methyltransferase CheR [Gemmataceae bacterium]|nr:protein-glutamate O-methyltransferase CheR [Gemmataceae bacterium]